LLIINLLAGDNDTEITTFERLILSLIRSSHR
jgi:hypothetical protein